MGYFNYVIGRKVDESKDWYPANIKFYNFGSEIRYGTSCDVEKDIEYLTKITGRRYKAFRVNIEWF